MWKLGARRDTGVPLSASPLTGKFWQLSHEPPRSWGEKQASATLIKLVEKKRRASLLLFCSPVCQYILHVVLVFWFFSFCTEVQGDTRTGH